MQKRLLRTDLDGTESLQAYRETGGYGGLQGIQKMRSEEIIAELEASGLRGRGGAGFPSYRKWDSVSKAKGTRYVVVNATEGEPDSLKDRTLLFSRPHLIVEGVLIACKAVKSNAAWVIVNEEFHEGLQALSKAVNEARQAGLLWKTEIRILTSPPRYVVGEETALLNWIEGKPAKPRFKLHLPVHRGLWGQPTLIQNAETIANVPYIYRYGAGAFRAVGTDSSPGTGLFSLQGDVEKPGLYELPLGTPLSELIALAGGIKGNKRLKAALIGGNFGGFLYGEALQVNLDHESLRGVGGSLGCGIVRVYQEESSIEDAAREVLNFFSSETCGQCGPCHMGTQAMHNEFSNYCNDANYDLQKLDNYSRKLRRTGACGLLDGATIVAESIVNYVKESRGVKA